MKIDQTIEPYINYISTERRLAARTVTTYSEVLGRFVDYLHSLEIEDVERIYQLPEDDFVSMRNKLILRIFYETGMRRAELCGLKEHSFDMSALSVKVLGKRNKERIIPIENDLAHNIIAYLSLKKQIDNSSDALLINENGSPMTKNQIYGVVKKYMQGAKSEKISPHVFRHTFATHLLNEGADLEAIKELMGHANVGVTEIYTHVTREHLKEQYRHAHPRAKKK